MPLYMDFHDGMEGITIEEVKNAHTADLDVQAKYGVTFKQFWVNTDAGTVFCLVDGPDKASCEAVHKEAHGNLPCNLSEVESGFYELMMATGSQHGLAMDKAGLPDNASRTIVIANLFEKNGKEGFKPNGLELHVNNCIKEIKSHNGRELSHESEEIIGIFNRIDEAINCALSIQKMIAKSEMLNEFSEIKISVTTSQPLTHESDDFFEEGLKLAKRLCNTSKDNLITVSSLTNKHFKRGLSETKNSLFTLTTADEEFVSNLFDIIDNHLVEIGFNVESLSHSIGISRPQLYRKIMQLFGKSPNNLIRDLRLILARKKLKADNVNIAEVALQVGYSNPSYFSKCYQDKFGYSPSFLIK